MSADSGELYGAMRAYTEAALRLLREVCPDGPPTVIHGLDDWRRDPDGMFRLYDREQPFWVDCIWRHADRLRQLEEFQRLADVLRGTSYAAAQLDTLVGTASSRTRVDVETVADQILWRMAETGGLAFQEDRFVRAYETFDAGLRQTSVPTTWLAPLLGFRTDETPIKLATDLAIDRMTDEEISRCLTLGMNLGDFPASIASRMQRVTSGFAVRMHTEERKYIGDVTQEAMSDAVATQMASSDRVLSVLDSLRVFKAGRVSIPGVLRLTKASIEPTFANPGPTPWSNQYILSRTEVAEFRAFWASVERVRVGGGLGNAVRRFSYASERERPDDSLVDYMIAAESLFLSDANQPDRGEMRYRLSHRAALFIDSLEYSRRDIFRHVRRAYDARSAIVHGAGTVDPKLLKSPVGAAVSLHEFTELTGALIRQALRKTIRVATPGANWEIDWDALLFP